MEHSAIQSRQAELAKQVRTWVNQTFYGTMLRQMHNSPFKSELFSGGRGGQAFSELLDQHLTQRMGRSGSDPLVNSIVRRIVKAHPAEFGEWVDPRAKARKDVSATKGN